jgi:hypothetical protein
MYFSHNSEHIGWLKGFNQMTKKNIELGLDNGQRMHLIVFYPRTMSYIRHNVNQVQMLKDLFRND